MQPIRYRLAVAAVGLALAVPAAAQDTAPAADEPAVPATEAPATTTPATPAVEAPADAPAAETPAAGAPSAESGADAPAAAPPAEGTPAEGTPAEPEVMEIVKDTFGDWQMRCAPEGDECFMYQLAMDAQKNPVAEVSILKLPDAAEADAGVTIVTPLGTLLTTGVIVQVDAGQQRQYPFAWCSQVGCFSRFGLDKPSVDGMKRGNAGKITLVSVNNPQAPVTMNLSLSGFTAAYDSLQIPTAPAAPAAAPAASQAPAEMPAAPLAPQN